MHLGSVSLKNVGFGSELSWVCFVFIVSATKQFCFGEKLHQYFEGSYKKFRDGGFLGTDGWEFIMPSRAHRSLFG